MFPEHGIVLEDWRRSAISGEEKTGFSDRGGGPETIGSSRRREVSVLIFRIWSLFNLALRQHSEFYSWVEIHKPIFSYSSLPTESL